MDWNWDNKCMLDKHGGEKKADLFKQPVYVPTAAPHCIAELMPSTHKLGQLGNAKHREKKQFVDFTAQIMQMKEKGETH